MTDCHTQTSAPSPLAVDQPKLELIQEKGGCFTVRVGDKYSDGLTCDEALWTCACFIKDGEAGGYLRTEEEWRKWKAAVGIHTEPLCGGTRQVAIANQEKL